MDGAIRTNVGTVGASKEAAVRRAVRAAPMAEASTLNGYEACVRQ